MLYLFIFTALAGFVWGSTREAMYHRITHNTPLYRLNMLCYFFQEECFGHGFHHTVVDAGDRYEMDIRRDLSYMSRRGLRRRILFYAVPSSLLTGMALLTNTFVSFAEVDTIILCGLMFWLGQALWMLSYELAHFGSHFQDFAWWPRVLSSGHHLRHHDDLSGRYGFWWWVPSLPLRLCWAYARFARYLEDAVGLIPPAKRWFQNKAMAPRNQWFDHFGDDFPDGPPWMIKG